MAEVKFELHRGMTIQGINVQARSATGVSVPPSIETLPDPRHFADGQAWGCAGLQALQAFTPEHQWAMLSYLYVHFRNGGSVKAGLEWLRSGGFTNAPVCLSRHARRCLVSYVVRWLRVTQVTQKLTAAAEPDGLSQLRQALLARIGPLGTIHRQGFNGAREAEVTTAYVPPEVAYALFHDCPSAYITHAEIREDGRGYRLRLKLTEAGMRWLWPDAKPHIRFTLQDLDKSARLLGEAARLAGQSLGQALSQNMRAAQRRHVAKWHTDKTGITITQEPEDDPD